MSEFIKEEMSTGKSKPAAIQAWKAALADPSVAKEDHPVYGRLVHVVRGLRKFTGASVGMRASHERKKSILDSLMN